jgi:hypothetical protein
MNQSSLIIGMDAAMIGLCLADQVSDKDPDKMAVEWSGVGWSVKKTGDSIGCIADTPEVELASFKSARPKNR